MSFWLVSRNFFEENDHYPSAGEIDTYQYLPSSRSIQRSCGGLINIRSKLIPEAPVDHTKGDTRRKLASDADKRAKIYEEEFYLYLTSYLEEISIHEQKTIRPGNVSSDIFIYLGDSAETGIVIDLFYAQDLVTLLKIVNIKHKRYTQLPFEIIFILMGNGLISQEEINTRIANKLNRLPHNIQVMTESFFKDSKMPLILAKSKFTK